MNLREINRLVAEKVMDWAQGEYAKDKWYYKKNGQIHGMAKFVKDWNPSTNIADAMEVLDKFDAYQITKVVRDRYVVQIRNHKAFKSYKHEEKTLPLAICLAALKAVGVELEVDD